MVTLSEESRRMEEMMKMYGMGGMDASMPSADSRPWYSTPSIRWFSIFTAIRTGKRLQCSVSSSMIWL